MFLRIRVSRETLAEIFATPKIGMGMFVRREYLLRLHCVDVV
jgi:hypothetical protein